LPHPQGLFLHSILFETVSGYSFLPLFPFASRRIICVISSHNPQPGLPFLNSFITHENRTPKFHSIFSQRIFFAKRLGVSLIRKYHFHCSLGPPHGTDAAFIPLKPLDLPISTRLASLLSRPPLSWADHTPDLGRIALSHPDLPGVRVTIPVPHPCLPTPRPPLAEYCDFSQASDYLGHAPPTEASPAFVTP